MPNPYDPPPGYVYEQAPQAAPPPAFIPGPPNPARINADRRAERGLEIDEERNRRQAEEAARAAAKAARGDYSQDERNAAMFAYRAIGANEQMNELARARIYKPESPLESLFVVDANGIMKVNARTDNDRRFIAAARNWLAPILRRDTGAAVTDTELRNYMQEYIPAYEDSPTGIWEKAQRRDRAMRALYGIAPTAYATQYGGPAPRWQVLAPDTGRVAKERERIRADAPARADRRRNASPEELAFYNRATSPNASPSRGRPAPPSSPAAPARVRTSADYARIAPGASYIDPDGVRRTKPKAR